jgi:hypothetical protein
MYFQPFILPSLSSDRALKTYHALNEVWFTGIERQRKLQTTAAKDFYDAQLEHAYTLACSTDGVQFAINLFRAACEPLKLITVVSEARAIAADTHRAAAQLLHLQTADATEKVAGGSAAEQHNAAGRSTKAPL